MRGAADSTVKQAAVRLLTEQLLPGSSLWPIYGERWREPRYYSLLMQVGRVPGVAKVLPCWCAATLLNASLPFPACCSPSSSATLGNIAVAPLHALEPLTPLLPRLPQPFIISPAINLGDIAVALQLAPPGTSPDAAVRDMHPFPIFERVVEKAILHPATGECGATGRTLVHACPFGLAVCLAAGVSASCTDAASYQWLKLCSPFCRGGGGTCRQPLHHLLSRPGGLAVPHLWRR